MTENAYTRTLREIFAHVDYSRSRQHPYNAETYNLDRMWALMSLLGNPQDAFPSLHIAGSKGKGSTSAMAASILQAAGWRTGLYTSPHLHTFRERIRIDGAFIPRERLIQLWQELRAVIAALPRTTTFEIITALAFMDFSRPPVDVAVIEVGLGGRLDATNVIIPRACAITALSLEHTNLLGGHLAAIAAEKAGIIKPGVPVVTGPQPPEAMAVIEQVAASQAAPLIRVGEDWRWRIREVTTQGLRLDICGPHSTIKDAFLPLTGEHQALNATLAVALVHAWAPSELSEEVVREGLARTYWPGRLEVLHQHPTILLDSAHNHDSATRLRHALRHFPHRGLILLFGASADKDIAGMLAILGRDAKAIVLTRSFHPRAADPRALDAIARELFPHKPLYLTEDAQPGLEIALSLAESEDLILVAGSIFVVAAVREAWARLHPESLRPDDWAFLAEPIDGEFTPMLTQK
ncbi:MAG TPA: bifunctional folylpolyglutamate synthase/dihydrofolate synthase [Anaerolineae bacterium]|nr:bifunctional folylpolyglutamate synthase/dihydrofolate synthase [Anaerolineae bacterium]